jgi:hypothetical protein
MSSEGKMKNRPIYLIYVFMLVASMVACGPQNISLTLDQKTNFLLTNGFNLDTSGSVRCTDPCKVYINNEAAGMRVILFDSGMVSVTLYPDFVSGKLSDNQNKMYVKLLKDFYGSSLTNWVTNNLSKTNGNTLESPKFNGYFVKMGVSGNPTGYETWFDINIFPPDSNPAGSPPTSVPVPTSSSMLIP